MAVGWAVEPTRRQISRRQATEERDGAQKEREAGETGTMFCVARRGDVVVVGGSEAKNGGCWLSPRETSLIRALDPFSWTRLHLGSPEYDNSLQPKMEKNGLNLNYHEAHDPNAGVVNVSRSI
jgi:hypothetical protein